MRWFACRSLLLFLSVIYCVSAQGAESDREPTAEGLWCRIVTSPQDRVRAAAELKSLASAGEPAAQYRLAICYEMGLGVQASSAEAFHWYLLSAQQSNKFATWEVMNCYHDGFGTEKDENAKMRWLETAVHRDDLVAIGHMEYYFRWVLRNPGKANDIHRRLLEVSERMAKTGNYQAQRLLAKAYDLGEGVEANRANSERYARESLENMVKMALRGDPEACYDLASSYELGNDVRREPATALIWYKKAFSLGYYQAARQIAFLYETSDENGPDIDLVRYWGTIGSDFHRPD